MSFWLVQIISVVGVAAVILLTWAVGWSKRARIEDLAAATTRFAADFPAAHVKGGVVAKDKGAAILDLGDDLGLVTVLGDGLVTRKLRAGEFAAHLDKGQLVLTLRDPTLIRLRLTLGDGGISAWATRLNARPAVVMVGLDRLDPAMQVAPATPLDGRPGGRP